MKKYTYSDDLVQIAKWKADPDFRVEVKMDPLDKAIWLEDCGHYFINTRAYKYRLVEEVPDEESLPKVGEMVYPRDLGGQWPVSPQKYLCMDNDKYVCKNQSSLGYLPWDQIKRIPKEVPEKKKPERVWTNLYSGGGYGSCWDSPERAKEAKTSKYVRTVEFVEEMPDNPEDKPEKKVIECWAVIEDGKVCIYNPDKKSHHGLQIVHLTGERPEGKNEGK